MDMYGGNHGNNGTASQYHNIVDDMNQLRIAPNAAVQSTAYQQTMVDSTGKVAPTVPPKPRKPMESSSAIYSNTPAQVQNATVQDYYAINAPAPGTIGVATARVNKPMTDGNYDPLEPGKTGRSDSRVYNPEVTPPSHYTPPPPQPARSYTPVSKMAVHMGAPQPLYSNTATRLQQQQPTYSTHQQLQQQSAALYSNVPPAQHHQQQNFYANVAPRNGSTAYSSYGADSDFPLPPPEVLPGSTSHHHHHPSTSSSSSSYHHHHPPQAPASPVSSAYSELRRTNPVGVPHSAAGGGVGGPVHHHHQARTAGVPVSTAAGPGNVTYAPGSHASSAYESIYEPINPRPSSQMSTRSGGYGPVYSARSSNSGYSTGMRTATAAVGGGGVPGNAKEAEVDALTSMLVQSMESSGDPEFFGICARCGGKVVGEGSGCTAMEQVFHIRCFDCIVCHQQLQGKPFYAVDSKPYCEDCYLNTLEKCCVCSKPILDRILRATGKPYHPACFTCVVCSKALDGIPFTVDAANQIHCIDDFHKKFAPRCSVCQEPIMPEPGLEETVRVVALDRSFHINCYKCEDCGLLLSSESEGRGCYPLDGHVLCKSCNAARVQALSSSLATQS